VAKLPFDLAPVPFVMFWHRRNDIHPVQRWFRSGIETIAFQASNAAMTPVMDMVFPR